MRKAKHEKELASKHILITATQKKIFDAYAEKNHVTRIQVFELLCTLLKMGMPYVDMVFYLRARKNATHN